ncbi:lytic murein transglycosylase [Candidatus Pseudothioglobus sp. Uisw_050_01]|uniref:lytic murein transglycosylase n=1 Tax=Candidatus Pseudothioglobus sp. Uisw_050_01 TaxID=3230997 RepID=UPI003A895DBE
MFLRFFCLIFLTTSVFASSHSFEEFLDQVRKTATEQGVSKSTIDKAFFELTPRPSAIASDKAQAEFNQNFWHYVNKRVNKVRLNNGKDTLKNNASLLSKTSEKYGVPAYVIVAFLGLESNYGNYMGSESLIRSLATLAYDKRRSKFFTRELIAVLKLMDKKTIPFDATGSWAGAMGAVQFMPTNVIAYGVDANNDGKVDLWNEKADIYASAANFLNKLGWKKGEKWGREALIPKNFDYQLTGLDNEKTVNEWAALGVRRGNNSNLPKSNFKASLIVPMGHRGPAFLVYRNFDAIMGWNRSILYALSVAYLSDRLNGNAKLSAKTIDEPLLSKEDIMQIQNTLNLLGYDTGTPDGMAGSKTRKATRQFQSDIGLTADGYVGYELFQQLQ